jgi:putative hydrolase of the HAD superfamily
MIAGLALDYGSTLSSSLAEKDPSLGMRPVTDEAARVLREIHALGIRLALASNTTGPEQDRLPALRTAGVEDLFTLIVQSHVVGHAKPDPLFFHHLLHGLDLQPHQVMMVGNNLLHDVLPAVEIGMPAVLINPAPHRRGLPALATRLRSITELPALLTGRPAHG